MRESERVALREKAAAGIAVGLRRLIAAQDSDGRDEGQEDLAVGISAALEYLTASAEEPKG
jgi:hypothetical protein